MRHCEKAYSPTAYRSLGLSLHLGLHLSMGLVLSLRLDLDLGWGCLYGGHPRRCRLLGEHLCLLLGCLKLGISLLHSLANFLPLTFQLRDLK